FLRFKGCVLAEGAKHDQAGYARINQHFDVPRGGIEVKRLIVPELRSDGGENAFPIRFHKFVSTVLGRGNDGLAGMSSIESERRWLCPVSIQGRFCSYCDGNSAT